MASEIRVNTINNRSGLGTISITNSGAVFSGVTTFAQIKTTSGEVTVGTGASVFSPATNVLALGTNNTEKVRITSTGSVGIGTDNPGQKLQVQDGHIDVTNGSGHSYSFSYGKFTAERSAAQTTSEVFQGGYTGNTGTSKIYADGKAYFLNDVGIGTDNPVGSLEVRDSKANLIVAKDGLTVKSNSDLHTSYDTLQIGAGGALLSYSTATVTADTQFVHNAYRSSGGTFKYRYADTAARIRMNSPGGEIIFDNAASGSADADITFSERLRITSSGNVGIGTNTVSFTQFGSNTAGVAIQDIGATNTGIKVSDGNYHNYLVQAGNSNLYLSHYGSGGDIIFGTGSSGEERARLLYSGGLTFNGDTAAANALDDYEEGSWTATVSSGTVNSTQGYYTRVGRLVNCHVLLDTFSDRTSTSDVRVGGMPFTDGYSHNTIVGTLMARYVDQAVHAVYMAGDLLYFYSSTSGNWDNLRHNEINNSGSSMYITFTYMTA